MKFGESLSEGLVPEWKGQYLDYKLGKKMVKAASKRMQEDFDSRKPNDLTPLLDAERQGTVPDSYNIDDPNLNESEMQQQPETRASTKSGPSSIKFPFFWFER